MKMTKEEEAQMKKLRVPEGLISVNLTVNLPDRPEITYATDSEQALLARIDELEKANASMAADSLKWSSKLKAEMEACDRLARHRKQLMSALETERRVVRFTVDGELEIE